MRNLGLIKLDEKNRLSLPSLNLEIMACKNSVSGFVEVFIWPNFIPVSPDTLISMT